MKIKDIISEDIDPVTGDVLPGSRSDPDPVTSASDNAFQQEKKGVYAFGRSFEDWWNKHRANRAEWLHFKGPGMRVWTRGDGTRSRDPAYITPNAYEYSYPKDKLTMPLEQLMSEVWDTIKKLPGAKAIGSVSGEFGSSEFKEAISFKGLVLVKRGDITIEVMARSRITNKNSVWRHKDAEGNTVRHTKPKSNWQG